MAEETSGRAHVIAGGFPPGSAAGHDHDHARLRLLGLLAEQEVPASVANDFADLGGLAQFLIRRTQCVIEYNHPRGTALGLHQRFHLRIVDVADFILVVEIRDVGVVTHKAKAVAFERKTVGIGPAIMQHDRARI